MASITLGPKPIPAPLKSLRPAPDRPDVFNQLLPCSWRGIGFPVRSVRLTVAHDLAEHKYYGVDAASVEATGRAPMRIEMSIPFYNGIVPGKNEQWGILYPDTFRDFLKAFADKTSDFIQHPELGGIWARPVTCDVHHDANRRDGVEVSAHWVETIDPDNEAIDAIQTNSPATATTATLSLDAAQDDIRSRFPQQTAFAETFESLLNKVSGAIDNATTTVQLLSNKPAQIIYRAKTVQDSARRFRDATTWQLEEAADRTIDAMHDYADGVAALAQKKRKPISRYTVNRDCTLCDLANQLKNKIDDLVDLNPNLMGSLFIAAGTVVRYYA